MAIELNLATSQYGAPFVGAYFRVVMCAVRRTRNPQARHSVMIDVAGYAAAPLDDDARDIDFRRYHAPLAEVEAQAGEGILAKAYSWVMAQPDMEGAKPA